MAWQPSNSRSGSNYHKWTLLSNVDRWWKLRKIVEFLATLISFCLLDATLTIQQVLLMSCYPVLLCVAGHKEVFSSCKSNKFETCPLCQTEAAPGTKFFASSCVRWLSHVCIFCKMNRAKIIRPAHAPKLKFVKLLLNLSISFQLQRMWNLIIFLSKTEI